MNIARILVIGSGGREHALARRLANDPQRPDVTVAPGNEGISLQFRCAPIAAGDTARLIDFTRSHAIDLVVVGPELPLALGLADALRVAGIRVFGPSRAAAALETSKWFAKDLMRSAGVPTARAERHSDVAAALAALNRFAAPWVVKADGLAAGKGVCVSSERDQVEGFVRECLEGDRFGASGLQVVIEEFLSGQEASVMAVCDGERFMLLPAARDYKRAHDGDIGSNTGGMGGLAPMPRIDAAFEAFAGERIVAPVLRAMRERASPFAGVLYAGLMIEQDRAAVLEFNARFGDPEAQVVLPLVGGSLSDLLASAAEGRLDADTVQRRAGGAVSVALVDEAYPDALTGAGVVVGLDALDALAHVHVLHAASTRHGEHWRISGGRGVYVVAEDEDVPRARVRAYAAIDQLGGVGWRCRRDIGNGAPVAAARMGGTR